MTKLETIANAQANLEAAQAALDAAYALPDDIIVPTEPEPPALITPPVPPPSVAPAPTNLVRNEDGSLSFDAVTVDGHLCTSYIVRAVNGPPIGHEVSGPDEAGRMRAYNITENAVGYQLAVCATAFWHVSGQEYPEGEAAII